MLRLVIASCVLNVIECQQSTSTSTYPQVYNVFSDPPQSEIFLVENPNYQYLNPTLASEYENTYINELRQYSDVIGSGTGSSSSASSSSGSSNIYGYNYDTTSTTNSNSNGYTSGSSSSSTSLPVLSNDQQNQVNWQQIQQAYAQNPNPTAGNTYSNNIYGYSINKRRKRQTSSTLNYVYPFGQYAPSSVPTSQIFYNPSNPTSNTNTGYTSGSATQGSTGYSSSSSSSSSSNAAMPQATNPEYEYSLFRDDTSTPLYQSVSDLKTTRLRDQNYTNLGLRGEGPMPGPSIQSLDNGVYSGAALNTSSGSSSSYSSSSTNQNQVYYDTSSGTSSNQYSNSGSSSTGSSSSGQTVTNLCALTDPYWCSYYVQIYLSSDQTYDKESKTTACKALIASLTESYNGCCNTVKSAGCTS